MHDKTQNAGQSEADSLTAFCRHLKTHQFSEWLTRCVLHVFLFFSPSFLFSFLLNETKNLLQHPEPLASLFMPSVPCGMLYKCPLISSSEMDSIITMTPTHTVHLHSVPLGLALQMSINIIIRNGQHHHHNTNTHCPHTFCSPDLCPAYHHLSFDAEPKTCYNRYEIVLPLITYHWLSSWLPAQLSLQGTIPYTDFQRAYLQLFP